MKIVAHQPQFLPWGGFWAKVMVSDSLILMPNVQWDKGQTSNRVKVLGQWVTVPVHVTESRSLIDVRYDPESLRKVILTLEQRLTSRKMPYGYRVLPIIDVLLGHVHRSSSLPLPKLFELNITLLECVMQILGLRVPVTIDLYPLVGETKTERLKQFVLRNSPDSEDRIYVSGAGGRDYLEDMSPLKVEWCEGTWEDCSIAQLIAQHEHPLEVLANGVRK